MLAKPINCSAWLTDETALILRSVPIRVLLVEDDIDVSAGLGYFLESRGVSLDFAYSAREARALALHACFDVIVLDVQLPDGDGIEICGELKDLGLRSPILFLTARANLEDKLKGFQAGAVDYVIKPFAPAELLARIQALAKYFPASGGLLVRAGDFTLDPNANLLSRREQNLNLNPTAAMILRKLMEVYPGSARREELNTLLWGDCLPASDPLRMHIYELRRILSATFDKPLITTVRGLGYRFGG